MSDEETAPQGDAYDPMQDPERRPRRSSDPGWKYGYWLKVGDVNAVVCNLCKKVTNGGIKRHKEHLAATGGDATGCPGASTQLRREIRQYLDKNRRNPVLPDDDDAVVEVDATGARAATTRPSSGTAAKHAKKAFASKFHGKKSQSVATKSIISMLRKKPEDVVDDRRSGTSQTTMESSTKTEAERHYVNMQWALFFYECGIPFHAATSRQFGVPLNLSIPRKGTDYK